MILFYKMLLILEQLGLKQKNKSLPLTLELMIDLIELEYSDKEIPDLESLCRVLNEVFETDYTEAEIRFSILSSIEEEDVRLQYKHLNLV